MRGEVFQSQRPSALGGTGWWGAFLRQRGTLDRIVAQASELRIDQAVRGRTKAASNVAQASGPHDEFAGQFFHVFQCSSRRRHYQHRQGGCFDDCSPRRGGALDSLRCPLGGRLGCRPSLRSVSGKFSAATATRLHEPRIAWALPLGPTPCDHTMVSLSSSALQRRQRMRIIRSAVCMGRTCLAPPGRPALAPPRIACRQRFPRRSSPVSRSGDLQQRGDVLQDPRGRR